jgi:hypothetical protein
LAAHPEQLGDAGDGEPVGAQGGGLGSAEPQARHLQCPDVLGDQFDDERLRLLGDDVGQWDAATCSSSVSDE